MHHPGEVTQYARRQSMGVFGVFSRVANLNELLLQGFEILRKLQHNFNEAKDEIH
jgi:hypothetical protein